jgi:hypothetical protein
MAYAILVNAKPGDIARFERRGVEVVNLPGSSERYGEVLAAAFSELREYRRDNAAPTLKPTEEKPLQQLLLPRDAMTRLCFFRWLWTCCRSTATGFFRLQKQPVWCQ